MESRNWCESQKIIDQQAKEQAESLVGYEKRAFEDAMEIMAQIFDLVAARGPIHDLPTKRKISVALHSFNLLWSSWNDILTGRYDAATDHWRSIDEGPDYLKALHAEPSIADMMGRSRVKVHAARAAIKRNMDSLMAGTGAKWLEERNRGAGTLQGFSHISVEALSSALGIVIDGDRKTAMLRPGGDAVAEPTVRLMAIALASHSIDLAIAMVFAFQDTSEVDALWDQVRDLSQRNLDQMKADVEAFAVPHGELDSIVLLQARDLVAGVSDLNGKP